MVEITLAVHVRSTPCRDLIHQSLRRPLRVRTPVNKVLKNTYLLLSMTLLFSAAMAGLSMTLALPHPGLIITLVGYFGLLFLTAEISQFGLEPGFRLRADRLHGADAGPGNQRLP